MIVFIFALIIGSVLYQYKLESNAIGAISELISKVGLSVLLLQLEVNILIIIVCAIVPFGLIVNLAIKYLHDKYNNKRGL